MNNLIAPVVLFVYDRLNHTRETIEALLLNSLASETIIYIYSDAAKNENVVAKVENIRSYLHSISGFKEVIVYEREKNLGLAKSIVDGVSYVVDKHGSVIVLEDDLVTSPFFLKFMNESLEKFKNNPKVWHVAGWSYSFNNSMTFHDDTFLWRGMNCWGWATWSDRWELFEKNPIALVESFSKDDIYKFNIDGYHNFWKQVLKNKSGSMNTWAIFWYATIFKNKGLCLNPVESLIKNIGLDGTGEHCGTDDMVQVISLKNSFSFPNEVKENKVMLKRIQLYYKIRSALLPKVIRKARSLISKMVNYLFNS
jgi:hypothetical protein